MREQSMDRMPLASQWSMVDAVAKKLMNSTGITTFQGISSQGELYSPKLTIVMTRATIENRLYSRASFSSAVSRREFIRGLYGETIQPDSCQVFCNSSVVIIYIFILVICYLFPMTDGF